MAALKELKKQQDRIERDKGELEARLGKVTDEAEKARLLAEIKAKDAELAANKASQKKTGGGAKKSDNGRGGISDKRKRPGINVIRTDDPLDSL